MGELDGVGSGAQGINDLGQVAGGSYIQEQNWTLMHPFRWSRSSGIHDLGTEACGPAMKAYGIATDINNTSKIVGSLGCVDEETFVGVDWAAIWDATNGWRKLVDLIPPDSGWELHTATAINDHGQIVGYGFKDDFLYRGFLLTPNEGPPAPRTYDGWSSTVSSERRSKNRETSVVFSRARAPDDDPSTVSAEFVPCGLCPDPRVCHPFPRPRSIAAGVGSSRDLGKSLSEMEIDLPLGSSLW
jgi:probable HAF family extracellular repeat protein